MKIAQYHPADRLKPFIKTFTIIESEHGMESHILPDTSLVIAFRYKGTVKSATNGIRQELPLSVITGIRKSVRIMEYARDTANLLVIFRAAGAAAFFRAPLHELSDISLPLDTLIHHQQILLMEEQLAGAASNTARIALVEKWLLSKLNTPAPDPLVQHAIQQIYLTQGNVRIKDLAGSLYISQDAFEKRFRRLTGASPKQFSSIVRFKYVIDGYPQSDNLTGAAFAAGYFDQAHFIKDFRAFTGQTPQDFFRAGKYW